MSILFWDSPPLLAAVCNKLRLIFFQLLNRLDKLQNTPPSRQSTLGTFSSLKSMTTSTVTICTATKSLLFPL